MKGIDIQDVARGKVNIVGGHSIGHSKKKSCNVGMAFVALPLLLGLPLSPPPCPPLLFPPSLVEPVLASRASHAACEGTRLLSADLSTAFGSKLVFDVLFRLEHSTHCGSGLAKVSHTFSVC
jgi:hypothetical protein